MPSSLRTAISNALYYISKWFKSLSYRFDDAADRLAEIPLIGTHIATPIYKVANYCYYISGYFTDLRNGWLSLCNWLDAVWDKFGDLWDALNDLWDYALAAYDTVKAIAGVIGTTFSQIVQFIEAHATTIYQTIYNTYQTVYEYITEYITNVYQTIYNTYQTVYEYVTRYVTNVYQTIKNYITNVYQTIKNYITNVYQTIQNIYNTYVTNIIGVAEDWVRDFVSAALAPFTAPFNLVNLWFDAIQNFFNDPWGWLVDQFTDWFLGHEQ